MLSQGLSIYWKELRLWARLGRVCSLGRGLAHQVVKTGPFRFQASNLQGTCSHRDVGWPWATIKDTQSSIIHRIRQARSVSILAVVEDLLQERSKSR